MLLGLGGISLKPSAALGLLDPSSAQHEFKLVAEQAAELERTLPTQYEYFAQFH
jgi:tryptophan halogenase